MKRSQAYYEFKQAIKLLKELYNPISSFLYYIGVKDNVIVKSKKIGSFKFDSSQRDLCHSLLLVLPYLKDSDKQKCKDFFNQASQGEIVELEKFKVVREECGIFAEEFCEYPYEFKNMEKGMIILDIGSNVGDTALDFASKGLTVYGFEPVKELYELSLKNVGLNPHLKDKTNLFNYAVSYKKGTISIDKMDSTSDYVDTEDSYEIEVITLEDILSKFNIKPTLLKMDCEGCEFDIVRNTDLRDFEEIIMEHHAGLRNDNHEDIVNILEKQGFKVNVVPLWTFDIEDIGIIHAYK